MLKHIAEMIQFKVERNVMMETLTMEMGAIQHVKLKLVGFAQELLEQDQLASLYVEMERLYGDETCDPGSG